MKNDTVNEKDKHLEEAIVIADECGDSMWDAVLSQEVKACEINKGDSILKALFNTVGKVQECDATEAK
jgi:hypothetical protein